MPCTVKYTAFLAGFGDSVRYDNVKERPVVPVPLLLGQFTVTVKTHSEDCPLGATARHVFVVTPAGKIEPLDKPLNKNGVNAPSQLSVAVGAV